MSFKQPTNHILQKDMSKRNLDTLSGTGSFATSPSRYLSDDSEEEGGKSLLAKFLSHSQQKTQLPPEKAGYNNITSLKVPVGSTSCPTPLTRDRRNFSSEKDTAFKHVYTSLGAFEPTLSQNNNNKVPGLSKPIQHHRSANISANKKSPRSKQPNNRYESFSPCSSNSPIQTVSRRVLATRQKPPPRQRFVEQNVSSVDQHSKLKIENTSLPSGLAAHRPRRSHAGPINYYSNRNYEGYQTATSEDIEEIIVGSSKKGRSPLSTSSEERSTSRIHSDETCRVLYATDNVQILRRPFHSLNEFPHVTHAPYAPADRPADYVNRSPDCLSEQFLHFSFSQDEMSALLRLLPCHGLQSDSTEALLVDQIIEAVQLIPDEAFSKLPSRIRNMCELHKLLAGNAIADIETYLLEVEEEELPISLNPRVVKRIARVVNEIIFPGQNHGESIHHSAPKMLRSVVGRTQELSNSITLASILNRRDDCDLWAFLLDAKRGILPTSTHVIQCVPFNDSIRRRTAKKCRSVSTLLLNREIGYSTKDLLMPTVNNRMKVWKEWKGASNDVVSLSWSPDGTRFAAGATAQCDEHNMQYNRGNNLLLGDLLSNSLRELSDHRILRPSTSITSDRHLYMSVSAVQWFGDKLYTASYDDTVKVWDVSTHANATCVQTLRHRSKVDVMARSNFHENVLATGTKSVGLWNLAAANPTYTALDMNRPRPNRSVHLVSSSLAWGNASATNVLVAGMSANEAEHGEACKDGYLAVWQVDGGSVVPLQITPNSQNIFDIKWHPTLPQFATGSVSSLKFTGIARDIRSYVRVYDPLRSRRCTVEIGCPALDINDVSFCPVDTTYITASCTDGITYVWDLRNLTKPLHKLPHGAPLNQLDESLTREQADVGVRVALWGNSIDQFYTGGSDGVLKTWNILLSSEDVHTKDVATFEEGIMSGAFSADKTNLLLGDSAGGIHLLSSGPVSDAEISYLNFEPAVDGIKLDGDSNNINPCADLTPGIEAGECLLSSGQLMRHPIYGVGKGPAYRGPYAAWARPNGTSSELLPVTPLCEAIQAIQLDGPPVERRHGLDSNSQRAIDMHIRLAHIRNQKRNEHKRKRDTSPDVLKADVILIDSDEEDSHRSVRLSPRGLFMKREGSYRSIQAPSRELWTRKEDNHRSIRLFRDPLIKREDSHSPVRLLRRELSTKTKRRNYRTILEPGRETVDLTADTDSEDESNMLEYRFGTRSLTLTDQGHLAEEDLEDDYWWPDSGKINPNIGDSDF